MPGYEGTSVSEVPPTILTSGIRHPGAGSAAGRVGGFGSIGFSLRTNYRMRGWSATLDRYVEWSATLIDTLAIQAPLNAKPLTYIVWLGAA